jgi:hypothetical protein
MKKIKSKRKAKQVKNIKTTPKNQTKKTEKIINYKLLWEQPLISLLIG